MESKKTAEKDFSIVTDKHKMDIIAIHDFLSKKSSWSKGIPFEKVKTAVENSYNFGLFYQNQQIGYARVISDGATIAYLGDVYLLESYRGLGLSKILLHKVMNFPKLQGLRRWILLTSTAPFLYEKYGFTAPTKPEFYMEKFNGNVYEAEK